MKYAGIICIVFILTSFQSGPTLKGTWQYQGGISNGKAEGPPTGYSMQRKYTDTKYEAFVKEPGEKAERYESGDYVLKGDTCFETQTYSEGPSKVVGKMVPYRYTIRNDTLTLTGTLPTGATVTEYWKKARPTGGLPY